MLTFGVKNQAKSNARRMRRGALLLLVLGLQGLIGLVHRPHGDVTAPVALASTGYSMAAITATTLPTCAGCPDHRSSPRAAGDCSLCRLHLQPQQFQADTASPAVTVLPPTALPRQDAPVYARALSPRAWGPRGPPA